MKTKNKWYKENEGSYILRDASGIVKGFFEKVNVDFAGGGDAFRCFVGAKENNEKLGHECSIKGAKGRVERNLK